ncbi:MAG: cell division protein ZapA [Bacteroidetes bacterium]|nr:cell division protein ZapA [Bacteroidota bacterium]
MIQSIRVKIGGKEYTLRGEDEQKIRSCAAEVDSQFQALQGKLQDQSTATLAVISALNLAEKNYDSNLQTTTDATFIAAELDKMSTFLEQCWKKEK